MIGDRFRIMCAGRMLDLSEGPVVMGILNTTPDSFYDGGTFRKEGSGVDIDRAFEGAVAMVRAGAAIIDVGGESTRPGAGVISGAEEIERTVPLIMLLRERTDVLISVDTYKAEVAERALEAGAHIVNDISGFTFDDALPAVCRRYGAGVILMHTPVKPGSMGWSTRTDSGGEDIVARVRGFLQDSIARAVAAGLDDIIIDPGFGFGKSVDENFRLLRELASLRDLGRPILTGVSRKSFLGFALAEPGGNVPAPSERLAATLAAETIALMHGASVLRVHDVREAMDCLRVFFKC